MLAETLDDTPLRLAFLASGVKFKFPCEIVVSVALKSLLYLAQIGILALHYSSLTFRR